MIRSTAASHTPASSSQTRSEPNLNDSKNLIASRGSGVWVPKTLPWSLTCRDGGPC